MTQLIEKLKGYLENREINNVLIFPHNLPDGDTLGSAIGIQNLIKSYNKNGYIVINDDIPSNLLFLFEGEYETISSHEAASLDYQLIIAVDTGELKLIEDRTFLMTEAVPVINIDHHITNQNYGDLNIVEAEASSTGELVFKISKMLEVQIGAACAQGLYAAIVTDTGNFRYSNTREYTFKVCGELMGKGFDFNRLNVEIFQNKSFEKLLLLNKIFDTLALHYDGKCAVVKLERTLKETLRLEEYDTDGVVEYVRDIKGVEVVVFIKHMESDNYKVSMRSKNEFDVSQVALAFEGGGHKKAAGFRIDQEINMLEKAILKKIGETI